MLYTSHKLNLNMDTLKLLVSVILFLMVLSSIILYWTASLSLISFYRHLREKYPEIRNNLGPLKGSQFLLSQMLTIDAFVKRIFKTYLDTFNLFRSFGNKIDIENFYQNTVDIKAVRATGNIILISKWESFLSKSSLSIKGFTLCLVLMFSAALLSYTFKGLNYLHF